MDRETLYAYAMGMTRNDRELAEAILEVIFSDAGAVSPVADRRDLSKRTLQWCVSEFRERIRAILPGPVEDDGD